MRRNIGIGLLVILNLTFVYTIVMGVTLIYRFIDVPSRQYSGDGIIDQTTKVILTAMTIVSIIIFTINYFLIKRIIEHSKPFLISLIVGVSSIIVITPYFISARQSVLDYQAGIVQLQHYLDQPTITAAQIIMNKDTIQIQQLDVFLNDIGLAKYRRGPWKFAKKIKLKFERTDGSNDSITTNGEMFGPYKGKYFRADQNVLEKYLRK
jgi:hypothetical protein